MLFFGKMTTSDAFSRSAHKLSELLRRLRYDASVRFSPEHLESAAAEIRRDVEWLRVQPDVNLKVYWKVLPIGKGPAISLYAFGFQILRFDCFGATRWPFSSFSGLAFADQ